MSLLLLAGAGLGGFRAHAAEVATSAFAKSVAASVYSAMIVHDFLIACGKDRSGCSDKVGSAVIDKVQYDGTSHICLTQTDYGAAVPQWLGAHPETATMATEDGIYAALKALYPC